MKVVNGVECLLNSGTDKYRVFWSFSELDLSESQFDAMPDEEKLCIGRKMAAAAAKANGYDISDWEIISVLKVRMNFQSWLVDFENYRGVE